MSGPQYIASDCILCGQCLEACPHHAIQVFSDIDKVKKYIEDGEKIVKSLSPLILGLLTGQSPDSFWKRWAAWDFMKSVKQQKQPYILQMNMTVF